MTSDEKFDAWLAKHATVIAATWSILAGLSIGGIIYVVLMVLISHVGVCK
jgi:hypothetical protein